MPPPTVSPISLLFTRSILQELHLSLTALVQVERLLERQALLDALQRPLGFDKGRPVAALLAYRCAWSHCAGPIKGFDKHRTVATLLTHR